MLNISINAIAGRCAGNSVFRRLKCATALMSLLLAGMVAIQAPPASAGAPAVAAGAMPFGLFQSSNNLQYTFPVTPAYAIQYYGWYEGFQVADAQAAWSQGTETFAELQTCGNPCGSPGVPVTSVTAGNYDGYLTRFATSVRAFGHPVLMTFDHEMNGNWYPWGTSAVTPAQWIAAWQHVTSLISSIAPNVTWVWAPNIEQGAAAVSSYWPGNGYPDPHVDVVGIDGYYRNAGSTWANTFARSVADASAVSGGSYPFLVAETGVPSADSDNTTQIRDLVTAARAAHAIALMYFDSGAQWTLTSAEESEFINDTSGPSQPLWYRFRAGPRGVVGARATWWPTG
jgi:hypothetical protein